MAVSAAAIRQSDTHTVLTPSGLPHPDLQTRMSNGSLLRTETPDQRKGEWKWKGCSRAERHYKGLIRVPRSRNAMTTQTL